MQRKLFWVVLLGLAFLFRGRLLEMVSWPQGGISVPAVLIALAGAGLAYFVAYALVTALQLKSVTQVGSIVVFGGILANHLGHWLGGFPIFDEFWGGVIAGALETAILYGALYGAKEVWTGGRD